MNLNHSSLAEIVATINEPLSTSTTIKTTSTDNIINRLSSASMQQHQQLQSDNRTTISDYSRALGKLFHRMARSLADQTIASIQESPLNRLASATTTTTQQDSITDQITSSFNVTTTNHSTTTATITTTIPTIPETMTKAADKPPPPPQPPILINNNNNINQILDPTIHRYSSLLNSANNNNVNYSDNLSYTTTMQPEQSFSEWWQDYWSRQPFPSGYTQSSITLLACFISTMIFLIVVGNLLVCIAIFTEKSLKPTQNWFIASLAVSDMLLGALVMPISLARELMGFWAFGPLWCDVHEAMDVLLSTASINTLCLISLDRYWSITQAVSYLKKRTPRRGAFMIAFVWFFSAAVSLPPLFGWKKDNASIIVPANTSGSNLSAAGKQNSTTKNRKRKRKSPTTDGTEQPAPLEDDSTGSLFEPEQEEFLANTLQPLLSSATSLPPQSSMIPVGGDSANQLAAAAGSNQQLSSLADQQQTTEYPSCQLSDDVGYVLYSALGSFYIPCAVMVFTYIKIFLAARSRARRAINKSARSGIDRSKRSQAAGRRANALAGSGQAGSKTPTPGVVAADGNSMISTGTGQVFAAGNGATGNGSAPIFCGATQPANAANQNHKPLVIGGGKLVCVERKKSLSSMNALTTSTIQQQRSQQATGQSGELTNNNGEPVVPVSLSTSGAKLASQTDAFNNSTDSSMITVMNASMGELPVTRFNFQATNNPDDNEQLTRTDQQASALLKAISQVGVGDKTIGGPTDSTPMPTPTSPEAEAMVPDIVVEPKRQSDQVQSQPVPQNEPQETAGVNSSTNETCFMTIEEDSDMFDAQAGRTIMMIAGNASGRKQATNLAKNQTGSCVMMPPATSQNQNQTAVYCNNIHCRQQRQLPAGATSASSYCGSSMTINDDDIDDCVDDELLTDDCNGYSVSCGLDQYCSGDGALNCPHCQAYEDQDQNTNSSPIRLPVCSQDSPQARRSHPAEAARHRHKCNANVAPSTVAHHSSNIDLEAQSLTGDDNLSLTEYRSNEEDDSSIIGHDVLDATESSENHSEKKKSKKNSSASGMTEGSSQRKRSMIGFRLGRLGSSAPLTSGGLLALASASQQQRQQQHLNQQQQATGRNLKALRQNFFLKLNQLTAKSVAKQEGKNRKGNQGSPSAPSSGTSYEPSIDCATTSNVQSADYHQDTMTDEYERNHASDSQQHRLIAMQTSELCADEGEGEMINGDMQLDHQSKNSQRNNSTSGDSTGPMVTKNRPSLTLKMPTSGSSDQVGCRMDEGNRRRIVQPASETLHDSTTESSTQLKGPASPPIIQPSNMGPNARALKLATQTGNNQINRSSTIISSSVNTGSVANKAYLASDNERHKRKRAKKRERRATLILGLIMAAFIISWMPFFSYYVLRAVCIVCREFVSARTEAFIFWLGYCNSAINPIIYTIFNRDFRRAFRKIIFRC